MNCKLCFHTTPAGLKEEIQSWLKAQGSIRISSMSCDANYYGYAIALFYTNGSEGTYDALVLSDRRHETLETAVNRALGDSAGKPYLVALGSNQNGHCMVVLFEKQASA